MTRSQYASGTATPAPCRPRRRNRPSGGSTPQRRTTTSTLGRSPQGSLAATTTRPRPRNQSLPQSRRVQALLGRRRLLGREVQLRRRAAATRPLLLRHARVVGLGRGGCWQGCCRPTGLTTVLAMERKMRRGASPILSASVAWLTSASRTACPTSQTATCRLGAHRPHRTTRGVSPTRARAVAAARRQCPPQRRCPPAASGARRRLLTFRSGSAWAALRLRRRRLRTLSSSLRRAAPAPR